MPKYYEKEDLEHGIACHGLREDLKDCLRNTDCVKIHKKTPKECLMSGDPSVPQHCYALRQSFFECKRSMARKHVAPTCYNLYDILLEENLLDNRQRFRGRKGY